MTVTISTDDAQAGWLKVHLVGNATAAGLVGQIANPEGVLLHIYEAFMYTTTAALAASTFNIGIGATGADSNTLVSAVNMSAAAGTMIKVVGTDLASEGAAVTPRGVLWPAASFLTVTSAAQVSTGLVADLYLHYIRLA